MIKKSGIIGVEKALLKPITQEVYGDKMTQCFRIYDLRFWLKNAVFSTSFSMYVVRCHHLSHKDLFGRGLQKQKF